MQAHVKNRLKHNFNMHASVKHQVSAIYRSVPIYIYVLAIMGDAIYLCSICDQWMHRNAVGEHIACTKHTKNAAVQALVRLRLRDNSDLGNLILSFLDRKYIHGGRVGVRAGWDGIRRFNLII